MLQATMAARFQVSTGVAADLRSCMSSSCTEVDQRLACRPSCRPAEEPPPCCRQLRPDDSRIVMELQQAGALSKRKRRRVEEEELQPLPSPPRMVRASSSMLRVKGGVANLGELFPGVADQA